MRARWEIHVKDSDGKWQKCSEFRSFSEAMETLKIVPGEWFINWGEREVVKGEYSLIKIDGR